MDLLTFTATLVGHLAWPATVCVVVVLLRSEIKRVLPLLRKIKAGPVEAEFEREVAKMTVSATQEAGPTEIAIDTPPERLRLVQLAELNPRAAILEAWRELEVEIVRAASQSDDAALSRRGSLEQSLRALATSGILSGQQLEFFNQLRKLRNRAAHAEDFNPELMAAVAYIELAHRLKNAVRVERADG